MSWKFIKYQKLSKLHILGIKFEINALNMKYQSILRSKFEKFLSVIQI